jgi:cell division protein FtsW
MSALPAQTERRRTAAGETATPGLDYQIIAIVVTFLLLGLVMVLSASLNREGTYFFLRQLMWVVVGVVACVVMAALPYRMWRPLAIPVMLFTLAALVAVLVLGDPQGKFGADRTLFGGRIQPSEIAKLAVVIYVAAWAAARGKKVNSFTDGMLPFIIIIGLVAGLIAAEKSFSVTIIVLAVGLTIYFVGGGHPGQLFLLLLMGLPLMAVAMYKAHYPWDRVVGWYNVWFNPSQAPEDLQRLMLMLREGRGSVADPSIWNLKAAVPGLWSDYLFANIGADLPVIGTFLVVALYAWFGYRALGIALNAPDRFGALTAVGLTAWILIQAAIHIGTSLTLIPPTGQPLPFMSYGGSSLVSCMAAAGLLLSISRAAREKKAPYAHFSFGWRDWRPRLPDSRSRKRSDERRSGERRYASERDAAGEKRPVRKRRRSPLKRSSTRGSGRTTGGAGRR